MLGDFAMILPASMKETHEIQLISGVILGCTSHPGGDSRFVPFWRPSKQKNTSQLPVFWPPTSQKCVFCSTRLKTGDIYSVFSKQLRWPKTLVFTQFEMFSAGCHRSVFTRNEQQRPKIAMFEGTSFEVFGKCWIRLSIQRAIKHHLCVPETHSELIFFPEVSVCLKIESKSTGSCLIIVFFHFR